MELERRYSFSGIYPHLAVSNGNKGLECGIGAAVPWAGKLWYLTYPPSAWEGSKDYLYVLDHDLQVELHPDSVGGTHANRMIHKESNQLIIGPYFIDHEGNVRVVSPAKMRGRLTGTMRHLVDPENKVYFFSMESGLYEVDVHSLEVTTYYPDPSPVIPKEEGLVPGVHGKGAYTGQGRLVITNNAIGGALAEWKGEGDPGDGENWSVVDRNKYTEITGPGDIYGAPDDQAPLWALGWDHKSVLLSVCYEGVWTRYRLPKGSYTHEADHGWYTEWPRIRDVGEEKWLMDMFGQLFEFPPAFQPGQTAGIRPISTHHKMIVDFAKWNDQIALACNDASHFDNPMLGRSQSNLLFTSWEKLKDFGKPTGWGGVWVKENVQANTPSEPYLIAGFERRVLHLSHAGNEEVTFTLEIDREGSGAWSEFDTVHVSKEGYAHYTIPEHLEAEWIRIRSNEDVLEASAYFYFLPSSGHEMDAPLVQSLAPIEANSSFSAGIIRAAGDESLTLQLAASVIGADGQVSEKGYYEIGEDMVLRKTDLSSEPAYDEQRIRDEYSPVQDFTVDEASVIVQDEQGNKYRLPKGNETFSTPHALGWPRGIREVVTERSLMNVHGTFYELPRDSSGGIRTIQPISTHQRQIYDYASWRGMLVLSGCLLDAGVDGHYVKSEDGKAGLWFGNVDDLRRFGAPSGIGGPLRDTLVQPDQASDPYLMAGYLEKRAELHHDGSEDIQFTIEVDFLANGTWVPYDTITVPAGQKIVHSFPDAFSAHWVRVKADQACRATATFIYE